MHVWFSRAWENLEAGDLGRCISRTDGASTTIFGMRVGGGGLTLRFDFGPPSA